MSEQEKRNREEKLEDQEINTEGTAVSWISNFWFYNKWKVIIIAFATLLVTVCTLQMCGNETEDITVLYAGSCYIQTDHFEEAKQAFSAVLPEDFNNDGRRSADIASCHVYSDEQVAERKAQALEREDVIEINTVVNQRELQSYDQLILAGEYKIVVAEPWLYSRVKTAGGFRKLSDVLGYVPEEALDDYAVKFCELPFYEQFRDAFPNFTDDTLIAIRTESSIGSALTGKKKSEKAYEQAEQTFRAIIEFGK